MTIIRLPFSIPADFTRAIGYDEFVPAMAANAGIVSLGLSPSLIHPRRFVALYWVREFDALRWNDGSSQRTYADADAYNLLVLSWKRWCWLRDNRINLGSSDSEATHHLIIDRETNRGWVAPVAVATRIVEMQGLEEGS